MTQCFRCRQNGEISEECEGDCRPNSAPKTAEEMVVELDGAVTQLAVLVERIASQVAELTQGHLLLQRRVLKLSESMEVITRGM